MSLQIVEIGPERLTEYDRIPQSVQVEAVLEPELVQDGLGGILLHETPVPPYVKDYDSAGDRPSDLPMQFDVRKWGFFLALQGPLALGGAIVAFDTTGVFMLENRQDLAVLWDIRVRPEGRGAGIPLFRHAAAWARQRGCTQIKIETQNVNLPACRFYRRMGCRLGEIRRYGYAAVPAVAQEVMLCWYLDL
jgi:GNAT superfamily N-acetyltransferase